MIDVALAENAIQIQPIILQTFPKYIQKFPPIRILFDKYRKIILKYPSGTQALVADTTGSKVTYKFNQRSPDIVFQMTV